MSVPRVSSSSSEFFNLPLTSSMAAATTVQTNGNNNGDSRIENTSIFALLACSYSTILCLALTPNKLLFIQIMSQFLPVKYYQ